MLSVRLQKSVAEGCGAYLQTGGREIVPFVENEEALFRIADAVVQFFDDNAYAGDRLQFCIERVGEDRFDQVVRDAYEGRPYAGDFTHKPVAERG